MDYELKINRKELHQRTDLSALEFRFAVAMSDNVSLAELEVSDRTKRRILSGLKDKGVIKPLSKDPVKRWVSTGIKPLSSGDGFEGFEQFSANDIDGMGRDGRFSTFCRLYKADGNDEKLRKAWVMLENKNNQRDGDYTFMVHLAPVIFQAAQHQARWEELDLAEPLDPSKWITAEAFNNRAYTAKPGDDPLEVESDDSWTKRARKAADKLREMGEDFVSPHGDELPKQAARRLEAKLSMARRYRGML